MYEQPNIPLKKILAWSTLFIALLVVFYWLWSTAFVQISITNPAGNGSYTYQIVNQKSGKLTEVKSAETSIKKRLVRGSYSVTVAQADTNYVAIIKASGLLKTSSVAAKLNKEKARVFVGDNPGSCMNYVVNVLISYACTDLFENINIHQPASASTPTYVLKNPNPSGNDGYVQGIVQTSHETVALIKTPADSDVDGGYDVLGLGSNLTVASQRTLSNLDRATTYSLVSYKDGFMIYSQSLTAAYYYSSLAAQPVSISLASASSSELTPSYLSVADGLILTAFGSGTDSSSGNAQTEIIINNGGKSSHYVFNKNFTGATPCGIQMLCAVDSSGMGVYSLAGKKPKLLYSLRGVASVINSGSSTLVVTDRGVLRLDIVNRSGFLEYSFGDYRFNNLVPASGGYLLSLANPQGKKVALYINQSADNTGSIDKKILSVQKMPEVSSASVYGQYIFISPDLGQLIYNSSLQSYDYDPVVKSGINAKINQAIDKAGISRTSYQIINTAQ